MIPSKYQQAIFDAVEKENINILACAAPGSGKSTTLVGCMKRVPKYKKSISVSFSKQLQLDIQPKVPSHVECATLHSIGYNVLRNHYKGKLKLDQYKSFGFSNSILNDLTDKDGNLLSKKDRLLYQFTLMNLINMARITYDTSHQGFRNVESTYDMFCQNGSEIENAIKVFDLMQSYNASFRKETVIDFVDMLYAPVSLKMVFPKYDYVFFDEGQDCSLLQIEFLKKILKPRGRLIVVADEKQSIYGFSGASTKSVNILRNSFSLKDFPLSCTYRVPKKGVELLKENNPDIECPSSAIDGVVSNGSYRDIQEGDLVICRNTKPLVILYFLLLKMEKKCTIVGKEMESGLLNIIKRYLDMSVKEAEYAIISDKQYMESQLIEQGVESPKKHYKYVSFEEKTDILKIFFSRYKTVKMAKEKISQIFSQKREGIKLMTIHKSKGLESDRVFFITHFENNELIPSKYAISKEELQQEQNLKYVALSRFKKEMYFLRI